VDTPAPQIRPQIPRHSLPVKHVYQTRDLMGWGVLILLTIIFIATAISIHNSLMANRHPVVAQIALLSGVFIAFIWAGLAYSFRVSVRVILSSFGIIMVHGPWRHQISWHDVVRVSEWTELHDGIPHLWLALWSVDGTRLQVEQGLVGDFAVFRADVMDRLAHTQAAPSLALDLEHPLVMTEDLGSRLTVWQVLTVTFGLFGTFMLAFLPSLHFIGLILVGCGAITLLFLIVTATLRREVMIGPTGIATARGPFKIRIPWDEMYELDRAKDDRTSGVLGILGRGVILLLFRIDTRSGVALGTTKVYSRIDIRGGSGVHMIIHEQYFQHPEWLRARLRAEVQALHVRAATPIRVAPLTPTGPLAAGTVLPPEPIEGDSALWLRESSEFDPFR